MKTIVLIITIALSTVLKSQDDILMYDSSLKKYVYQEILIQDSVSKDLLYTNSKLFVSENYRSAKDVIQFEDKETGVLLCKGLWNDVFILSSIYIHHTIKFEVKEGKVRVTYSDFFIQVVGESNRSALEDYEIGLGKLKRKVTTHILSQITSFKDYLKTHSKASDGDW